MGLGLNGGGLEAARFLVAQGAQVTVTDLRDEKALRPSLEALEDLPIRFVLGKHEIEDFKKADFVIKNPAVKPDSPYLAVAKQIETDISIFLQENKARLSAVTGSKGKSSTSSALHWALTYIRKKMATGGGTTVDSEATLKGQAYLGGNITLSPLSFLNRLSAEDDVVLELSSWQLGDLKGRVTAETEPDRDVNKGKVLLKPRLAIITTILPDHLDRYGTMEAYVADKKVIYQGQDSQDATIVGSDTWGRTFALETGGRPRIYQTHLAGETSPRNGSLDGWIEGPRGPGLARLQDGRIVEVVPENPLIPGPHQKQNLLACALGLLDLGLDPQLIREALGSFPGIEHRLEFFYENRGIRFYNDTAAKIGRAHV